MLAWPAYQEIEHTADLRLEIRAWTWPRLLVHTTEALTNALIDPASIRTTESRPIAVKANTGDELALELLKQIHLLFDIEGFLVQSLRLEQCSQTEITGKVVGELYDEKRHQIRREIKAVTYHQLELEHCWWGWRLRVILDI